MKCPIWLLRMLRIRWWNKSVIFRPASRNEPRGAVFFWNNDRPRRNNYKSTHKTRGETETQQTSTTACKNIRKELKTNRIIEHIIKPRTEETIRK